MTPEQKLLDMLTWMRPHESLDEELFCQKYIMEGREYKLLGPMRNIVIEVGTDSKTLFSCHTDTVHTVPGMQEVIVDFVCGHAYKNDDQPLGADDTTGVWLMLEMINAGVPGTYVFHRGEECSGIGSRWLAAEEDEWLRQFSRAIAFDRKGETSVITKQRGSSCCSSEFALDLAKKLGADWKEDPTGSFTDTANYTHLIPECTNLSVGYYDQHTGDETQVLAFALELRDSAITLDWESLPTVREAKEEPSIWAQTSWSRGAVWPQEAFDYADTDMDFYESASDEELADLSVGELEKICRGDPYFAARKLHELLEKATWPTAAKTQFELLSERLDEFEIALAGLEEQDVDLDERLTALEDIVF